MEDESHQHLPRGPIDFKEMVVRQIDEVRRQMSAGSYGIDAIRALDTMIEPYKDDDYRKEYRRVRAVLSILREDGTSRDEYNQMLANGWYRTLMQLLKRRKFLPEHKTVKKGEELLQGI